MLAEGVGVLAPSPGLPLDETCEDVVVSEGDSDFGLLLDNWDMNEENS